MAHKSGPNILVKSARKLRAKSSLQTRNGAKRRGGKGGKVKSRKQAIAIALSKARKKGERVPKKK